MKKEAKAVPAPQISPLPVVPAQTAPSPGALISSSNASPARTGESILCAIRGTGRTLDFALREAHETGRRLYLLFVREQPFMTEQDAKRKWPEDAEASAVFAEAKQKAADRHPLFC